MDNNINVDKVKLVDVRIPINIYNNLLFLGILKPNDSKNNVRQHNVGTSDYFTHLIQPWSIWLDYPDLTPFDHDIIKRVLRRKTNEARKLDYEKIIHICEERIRQIDIIDYIELNKMKGNA